MGDGLPFPIQGRGRRGRVTRATPGLQRAQPHARWWCRRTSGRRSVGRAVSGGQHDPTAQHVAMLTAYSVGPGQQQPPLPIAENYPIRTRHRHEPFVARRRSVPSTTRRASPRASLDTVPTPPASTKTSLRQRLRARANDRWPQLVDLTIRHHGGFAYVGGQLPDGTTLPLFRPALRRLSQQLGLRDPSRQPQQLRKHRPAQRIPRRHPRRSPRLRLRPLPQRPNRLGPTPDELTGETTSRRIQALIKEFVDLAARRLDAMLADRPPNAAVLGTWAIASAIVRRENGTARG